MRVRVARAVTEAEGLLELYDRTVGYRAADEGDSTEQDVKDLMELFDRATGQGSDPAEAPATDSAPTDAVQRAGVPGVGSRPRRGPPGGVSKVPKYGLG